MRREHASSRNPARKEELLRLATYPPWSPRLREARMALLRMGSGLYGFCDDCEKRIPEARLRAKPEAIRCADCQRWQERSTVA